MVWPLYLEINSSADLPPMSQIVIRQHNRDHGFSNRHASYTNTRVVAAFAGDFGFFTRAGNGFARGADG